MLLVQVLTTRPVLTGADRDALAGRLADVVVRHGCAGPSAAAARDSVWVAVQTLGREGIWTGRGPSGGPVYHLTFHLPQGALPGSARASFLGDATRAVLSWEGTPVTDVASERVRCVVAESATWSWRGGLGAWPRSVELRRVASGPPEGGRSEGHRQGGPRLALVAREWKDGAA